MARWAIVALAVVAIGVVFYFLSKPIPTHAVLMNSGRPIAVGQGTNRGP